MGFLQNSPHRRPLRFAAFFYASYYIALAALAPFLTLYYREMGLTGRQIGLLAGLPPLIGLVSAPVFGAIADATHRHQRLLQLSVLGLAGAILGLAWASSFAQLLLPVTLYAMFMAPIIPLVDNTVMELLGKDKPQYGKIRLWGSLGWGVTAPLAGLIIEAHGLHWGFYLGFGLMLGTLAVTWGLPVQPAGMGHQFWAGLRLIITSWAWVVFLMAAFVAGAGLAIVHNYLFLYMADLGMSKTLMGAALSIAIFSETLTMLFSSQLLARWSTKTLLNLSLLALGFRLMAYTYAPFPWLVLAIQLMHGPTFAVLWLAGVAHANKLAPPGWGATAQSLFYAVSMSLGAAFGAMSGGWLYQGVGLRLMFEWASLGILICLIFFLLADRRMMKLKPLPGKLP